MAKKDRTSRRNDREELLRELDALVEAHRLEKNDPFFRLIKGLSNAEFGELLERVLQSDRHRPRTGEPGMREALGNNGGQRPRTVQERLGLYGFSESELLRMVEQIRRSRAGKPADPLVAAAIIRSMRTGRTPKAELEEMLYLNRDTVLPGLKRKAGPRTRDEISGMAYRRRNRAVNRLLKRAAKKEGSGGEAARQERQRVADKMFTQRTMRREGVNEEAAKRIIKQRRNRRPR